MLSSWGKRGSRLQSTYACCLLSLAQCHNAVCAFRWPPHADPDGRLAWRLQQLCWRTSSLLAYMHWIALRCVIILYLDIRAQLNGIQWYNVGRLTSIHSVLLVPLSRVLIQRVQVFLWAALSATCTLWAVQLSSEVLTHYISRNKRFTPPPSKLSS